ncbi:MAG TPA: Crp/Fnr family transcriptional regulator, partial [Bacteroidia bacterium]|nr:Crp/Fnr family transcriptional regulator [Bacteroidia bacterium]
MNTSLLEDEFRSKVSIPDGEFEKFSALLESFSIRRNEHFFQAGDVVKFAVFILKGCLRQYYISPEGVESTVYFAEEKWWSGDASSFRNATPTNLNLQAMEDCEVLLLSRKNWQYAFDTFAWYREYHTKGQQRLAARMQEKLGQALTETAEQKYLRLLKERPSLIRRVPQHYIATYLGLTPETLSRV